MFLIIGGIYILTIYKNTYITIKDKQTILKNKPKHHYIFKTKEEINYKNINKLIEEHNNNYITNLRKNTKLLDNINGYSLDEYQSKVVLSNEDSSLVVAGAGSGKSLTIIAKILYLIKIKNIKPNEILCMSFTNEATKSLEQKLINLYNIKINIYTFHKLALNILKQNNIEYTIAPDNYLQDTIDNFFLNILPNNNKLFKIYKSLNPNNDIQELIKLKKLIITFINLFKSNNYNLEYFLTIKKKLNHNLNIKEQLAHKKILILIINIYLIYENDLHNEKALDFNDMINKSIEVLSLYGLKDKYKYIIIDEYQDTSITKFNMINKIKAITNAKLLAVGDDFQSIYRFTGCNLNIFLNFTKYFKYAKIFNIINTYRNPQELINIAGSFIMKNKKQISKKLLSNKHIENPIIIYETTNEINTLKKILITIKDKDIMVIGRNNKDIDYYVDNSYIKEDNIYTYKGIKFKYLTAHKSKGLEANNVIIINMHDKITGFPSKIKEEKLLKYVNNTKDFYPYEEERRLFYVALTRTKNRIYIISPINNQSIFIKELIKYPNITKIKT